jgi:LysR family transcriptional regulator, hydrogen peroxide-inducible genes activator
MPTLKQLRYFEALARLGHFGKAAEHCAVTQPALSMQIAELEAELGVTLAERRARGVMLTDAGRDVAERARRVLAEVRDIQDFARARAEPLSGPLALGAIPTIAPYALPPLLPLLRARAPRLELRLRETLTAALIAELLEGALDLLLLALPLDNPDIATAPLFDDPFLLLSPHGAGAGRASDAALQEAHLLLLEEGHCFRNQALDFCTLRRAQNIDAFGAASLATLVQLVAAGYGQTLLPQIAVAVETARANVDVSVFDPPAPKRVIGLAWRATSPRKAEFLQLGALIKEAMGGPAA